MAKQPKNETKANNAVVIVAVAVIVLAVVLLIWKFAGKPIDTNKTYTSGSGQSSVSSSASDSGVAVENALDTNKTYFADVSIKDYGKITIKLDQKNAPATCANFVKLANEKFYDGLTFHRIIEGFMMQGGDPLGNGTGGSGQNIKGEFSTNGFNNPLSHTRGAISMARSGLPDSASSQFFIVHEDSTYLDGQYAVFGYVTEGIDVVDKVCKDAKPTDNNGTIPSGEQPIITSITIRTE